MDNRKVNNSLKTKPIKSRKINRSFRTLCFFLIFLIGILVISLSFANTQLINGKKIKARAKKKQTLDKILAAKRGNILDRNGEILAQSVEVDTISINPFLLEMKDENKNKVPNDVIAQKFSEIFGEEKEVYKKQIESKSGYQVIARKVEKEKVDTLKAWLKKMSFYDGISIDRDIKRYYPYNGLASNIIGFCNIDNIGIEGLEASMNNTLTGVSGRQVSTVDVDRNPTKDGPLKIIKPEDGKNIYLTIDVKVQTIAENTIKKMVEEKDADDGVAIVMDVKNGDILAMANYPTYNSNSPFEPVRMSKEDWDKLSDKERTEKLSDVFHNKAITMSYEPGSVFKVITSAIGLEEGKTEENKPDDFLCTGSQRVADWDIKCWNYPYPHGSQTLTQALGNSCNPSFIQLIQRIGVNPVYKYLEGFGFFSKTGIEAPGEPSPVFFKKEDVGIVELSTIAFGQRFLTTPIQMIRGVTSIINNGELITPTLIDKIEDPTTKVTIKEENKEVRKVVSTRTSEQIKRMLKYTVEEATGISAKIPGYSVGGKSGTSEPNYLRPEEGYIGSFYGVAPMENPKYAVLVVVRNAKKGNPGGGYVAGPVVKEILTELKRMEN